VILSTFYSKPASHSPKEFVGLLQEKAGNINEVLILPGTESSEKNTVLKFFMIPNIKAVCSIHINTNPNRKPPQAYLHFFKNRKLSHNSELFL
jgi:hypothetical protein